MRSRMALRRASPRGALTSAPPRSVSTRAPSAGRKSSSRRKRACLPAKSTMQWRAATTPANPVTSTTDQRPTSSQSGSLPRCSRVFATPEWRACCSGGESPAPNPGADGARAPAPGVARSRRRRPGGLPRTDNRGSPGCDIPCRRRCVSPRHGSVSSPTPRQRASLHLRSTTHDSVSPPTPTFNHARQRVSPHATTACFSPRHRMAAFLYIYVPPRTAAFLP